VRGDQDHGLWAVEGDGRGELQSGPRDGPDEPGGRHLLVSPARVLRHRQEPPQDLQQGRRLERRRHFLPVHLWQKGTYLMQYSGLQTTSQYLCNHLTRVKGDVEN